VPSGGFLNCQPLHLGFSSSFSPASSAPLSRKNQSFFDCPLFQKLAGFDYAGYLKANGLNSAISSKVEGYLKRGDITGVFRYNLVQFKAIRDLLNKLKYSNDTSTIPGIPNIRKVNESTSETLVFGQYVARVFFAIRFFPPDALQP